MKRSNRVFNSVAVLLLAASFAGCARSHEGATPNTEASAAAQSQAELQGDQLTRVLQMHQGYTALVTARDAFVSGDVDAARLELASIAMQPMADGIPPIWAPNVLDLHQIAARGVEAELPEGVAESIGLSANSCGSCHQATGYIPALAVMPTPPPGDDAHTQMIQHAYAAQELWDGLVTHNVERWTRGQHILRGVHERPEALFGPNFRAQMGSARVDGLNASTTQIVNAESWDERALAYGSLLSSCASCHAGQTP